MQSDPLGDVVRSMDLTGGVFLEAAFTAPWAITAHVTEEDCRPFMPVPNRVIAYHVITEGEAIVSLDSAAGYREHRRVRRGDVVILPSNPLHVLASGPGGSPVSGDDLLLPAGENGLVRIAYGGGGAETRLLCGFIASNSGQVPLLDSLPELLVVGIDDFATRRWIESSIVMAARELTEGRLARGPVLSRLSELMLIEALRLHIETASHPDGWLAGMAHPRIAAALARIHADLAAPPGVTELAAEAGMSRSAFVERFTEVMGVSPGRYVIDHRMGTARAMLEDGELGIAEIAFRVGYDSAEGFSRAFKRETGQSPAAWRDRHGQSGAGLTPV